MTEDEFILIQCDWTKMSIFLILTEKSELIVETERRKDVTRPKIVILTFYYARKRCWEHLKSFPNQQQPREHKVVDTELHVQQRSFLVKSR